MEFVNGILLVYDGLQILEYLDPLKFPSLSCPIDSLWRSRYNKFFLEDVRNNFGGCLMSSSPRILVTGGTGYIGSHTVIALVEAGYEPVIVDNFANSYPAVLDNLQKIIGRPVIFYEGDCVDGSFMDRVLHKEAALKGVVHFAAHKAVGESVAQPLKYYRNNIDSLLVLLEKMQAYQLSHLVFSSSCTVYGQPDQLPVTEQSAMKPAVSPYGRTKQICEEIIRDMVYSQIPLKTVALRYFNPVGAHPSARIGELPIGVPNNLIPLVTQTAAGIRDRLTVYGDDYGTPDGTCIRDYIHVVDLARAHVAALAYLEQLPLGSAHEIFNVGTGRGHSVLEVIHAFEKVSGVKMKYTIGQRRPGDIEQIFANVDKATEILRWKAVLGLEDALRDAWRWQRTLG
jgi:UDP-glucose 4-epimerase